ncbi:BCS1 N terminal-domain-containing protein [Dactylonectria estremocensis]|uniref:BCS1 N terminal-domain-containing protein n=1 Tax=Dactylonectria estremocensis TaxID=1079267 RepID=A0A9P9F2P7_9HYPO|nr:BCS1 N terminal-domain-containing protein [Dactylonectria estremocensis]
MESVNTSHLGDGLPADAIRPPQFAVLDYLIPGFSVFSSAIHAYMGIDLNLYIPLLLIISGLTFAWTYMSDYVWGLIEKYGMSVVRIRTDDETYNFVMSWVASQPFAQGSRRFIVNTNINSRSWFLWRYNDEDEDEEGETDGSNGTVPRKKPLQYTPSFGTHFFWYRGHLLLFERHENREQSGFLVVSEREEITISCFGRSPRILKELLLDARMQYTKKDESKTLIYRGAAGSNGGDPTWQRCMTRASRPVSTVILNEKVKEDLIADVTDYLNPATRRWYSNRGIPYRRGYLLYGPPGTGKSSLSLALAGFFRMRIYMVSLSSIMATEENLATLFAELPRRCVVLLEDIDSAGLTHTREEGKGDRSTDQTSDQAPATQSTPGKPATTTTTLPGRLSLSGLLNILDGVASQEGRVLIMTTNHLEKLDKALIRPGRVDMIVNFGLADADMTASIFRAIYAPYDGEDVRGSGEPAPKQSELLDAEEAKKLADETVKIRAETFERVSGLAAQFAEKIPEHEFSPAEIQGLLLKHKRSPEKVLENVDEWIVETRKEKKKKELDDAETRRKEEEERKKEEEKTKKEEAKKKRKEEKAKAKKKAAKLAKLAKRKAEGQEVGSDCSSDSDSDSESEADDKAKKDEDAKNTDETEKKADAEEKTTESKDGLVEGKLAKGSSDSGYDTPENIST